MTEIKKTILVLGAGTGGIVTAKELSKKIGAKVNILLFEKEEKIVFAPSLLWLMVGKRKEKQIYRDTTKISGDGIVLVLGEIESVDPANVSIKVKGQKYYGDYMVISLGAQQVSDYNLEKFGLNFYSLEGSTNFHKQLKNFHGGKIAILIPSLPFKCPAAPYEAAMLIESYVRKKGLSHKSEISIYTLEAGPMSSAGKELSSTVRQVIEAKGIKYFPEHQITFLSERELVFSNGKSFGYDLLLFTPKHVCPSIIKNTEFVGKSGWIEIDAETMETKFPNVFAIGDITFVPLEIGKPLPKAGVFAHRQAEIVASNIAQKISGNPYNKRFKGEGECFLELGDGKAGFVSGNFYNSPAPLLKMKKPSFYWHWAKVLHEKYWLYKYFSFSHDPNLHL